MKSKELGENYNKIAEWWTDTAMKNPEYGMEYIRKAMGYAKKKSKFLDIGCGGTGRVINEALKNNFETVGIDVSSKMIGLAKDKFPHVNLIHTDFLEWKTDDKFDLIIAWDSTFHTPKSKQYEITVKMCRMLNPEGILLFTSGAYAGEASGKMEGVLFKYGSIGYHGYLEIIEKMNCKMILIELDQFPLEHLVAMCQKQ